MLKVVLNARIVRLSRQNSTALWDDRWRHDTQAILIDDDCVVSILTVLSNKKEAVQVFIWCQHKLGVCDLGSTATVLKDPL